MTIRLAVGHNYSHYLDHKLYFNRVYKAVYSLFASHLAKFVRYVAHMTFKAINSCGNKFGNWLRNPLIFKIAGS